jgi:hypothetical protein
MNFTFEWHQHAELRKLFDGFDLEGKGQVTPTGLAQIFAELGTLSHGVVKYHAAMSHSRFHVVLQVQT